MLKEYWATDNVGLALSDKSNIANIVLKYMPGYITRAFNRFLHPAPTQSDLSPHPWEQSNYSNKTQFTPDIDTSPLLSSADKLHLTEVLRTLLCYARALDVTILTAISELTSELATGTVQTMKKLTQPLNCFATHPKVIISLLYQFHAAGNCI
jgi:hypothetical protein